MLLKLLHNINPLDFLFTLIFITFIAIFTDHFVYFLYLLYSALTEFLLVILKRSSFEVKSLPRLPPNPIYFMNRVRKWGEKNNCISL